MSEAPSYADVLARLAKHPREADLARLVHLLAFTAYDERRASLAGGVLEAAERLGLSAEDTETELGNVLRALERGHVQGASPSTRALLSGLLARGVALSPPAEGGETKVVEALLWLGVQTSVDAVEALEAALGEGVDPLHQGVAELIRRADQGRAPQVGRAGALLGAVALRTSARPAAHAEVELLRRELKDPVLLAVLGSSERAAPLELPAPSRGAPTTELASGELLPTPRGPVAFTFLALSGALAVSRLARLFARGVLRYRQPAELRAAASGVTVRYKTELLGRTLREREVVFPRESLAKAEREIQYPRLALYAGLFALAVGSYLGMAIFIDGVRATSPDLLGLGLLLVAVGIAVDYVLGHLFPAKKGECRVVLVPRTGRSVAVGALDPAQADRALEALAAR